MKSLNQKAIIIVLLLFNSSIDLLISQELHFQNQFFVKLNLETVNSEIYYEGESETPYTKPILKIRLEGSYELFKHFIVGIDFGYSTLEHRINMQRISDVNYPYSNYGLYRSDGTIFCAGSDNNYFIDSNTLFYGLSGTYQLLPLVSQRNNLRFDVYAVGKIGAVSSKWWEYDGVTDLESVWNEPIIEYGLGLGVAYYFKKNVGTYIEYSVGKFYNEGKSKYGIGLIVKL